MEYDEKELPYLHYMAENSIKPFPFFCFLPGSGDTVTFPSSCSIEEEMCLFLTTDEQRLFLVNIDAAEPVETDEADDGFDAIITKQEKLKKWNKEKTKNCKYLVINVPLNIFFLS